MLGIFLDLETNGLNPFKHRTLEIAFQILDLYTGELKASYDSIVYQPQPVWNQSDASSLQINGFTYQKLTEGKAEKIISEDVIEIFEKNKIRRGDALFVCQNPSFDRAFFTQLIDVETQEKYQWPYHWLDLASMYWALHMNKVHTEAHLPLKDGLSKDEIARSIDIPPEEKPHRALNGVTHLINCYKKVVGVPIKI